MRQIIVSAHLHFGSRMILLFIAAPTRDTIRNGVNRGTQGYNGPSNRPSAANDANRKNNGNQINRGLHESFEWYDACYTRPRNNG